MKLFWHPAARKRAKLFRELTRELLLSCQHERLPSCEQLIMREVDMCIDQSEKDFLSFPNGYDYRPMCLNLIKNLCYEQVVSGHFHVSCGVLKPIGIQLKEVCVQAAWRAHQIGFLTEDEYHNFLHELSIGINSMG